MACNTGRTIIARFDAGEDLLLSLKACAVKHGVKAGWFGTIGGLKELAFGLYSSKEHRVIRKSAKECFEILPTIGNISIKEGDILIHAHINVADESEGLSLGGHLIEGCKVFPFAEVFITECDADLKRNHDKTTNLWHLAF